MPAVFPELVARAPRRRFGLRSLLMVALGAGLGAAAVMLLGFV